MPNHSRRCRGAAKGRTVTEGERTLPRGRTGPQEFNHEWKSERSVCDGG